MDLFYNGFSNVPWWLEVTGLENTNTILWHPFHQRTWPYKDLINTPRWKEADRIFLVGQEGNIDHFIDLDSRIYVWDSLVKPDTERFYSYFWWWWQTIEVNHHQKLTDKLSNPLLEPPDYVFDCIMGGDRIHRGYIYNLIINSDIKEKCLLKYNDPWLSGCDADSKENLKKINMGPDCSNISGTMVPFYDQQTANISTWIPWKIYNQSWFSVVAETRHDQNFFTEKTAKLILAKKLFVYIGAAGALRDLRRLGFKTFDGIIDESYDLEPNDEKRWNMAYDQIQSVCNRCPRTVYELALPVLVHNQKLMLETNWQSRAISEMRKIVHGC